MKTNGSDPPLPGIKQAKILTLGEPRNPNLVKTLEAQGFKVELIQGIDAREMGRDGLERFADMDYLAAIQEGLSDGELACAIGHRRVYEKVMAQDIALTLVLEDDAQIVGSVTNAFTELGQKNLTKPTVISLFSPTPQRLVFHTSKLKLNAHDLRKSFTPTRSTLAYIINKEACEILASTAKVIGRADWPLSANLINFYLFDSRLIDHSDSESYLESDRGSRRFGLPLPAYFPEIFQSVMRILQQTSPKRLKLVRGVLGSWRLTLTRYYFPHQAQQFFLLWGKLRGWKQRRIRQLGKD